jgi:membrane protein implicated in regulation of membrane protease activity
MIRGFFRLVGLLLLAGGFIFMVYDGARWVADQTLRFTRFGQFWNDVFVVLGVLGILLMLVFRPRKPLIGYSRH